jgi:antitoxin PrlF
MQQNFTQSIIKQAQEVQEVQEVQDMKEIISTISSKGQVTVPAEVRKRLGIKQGDKLSFVIEDEGGVRLAAPRFRDLSSLRGAAGKLQKLLSWEEMREIAREDRVRKITEDK